MAEARIAKLRKEADALGVHYTNDTEEGILRSAIQEFKDAKVANKDSDDALAQTKAQASEIGAAVATAVKKAMAPDTIKDGIVSEADMDPDDEGERRTYFHPAIFWILPLKKVGGQRIKPPFSEMIKFNQEYGGRIRNGDQWNTRYMSVYHTKSKREQAYLETHPLYGKSFSRSHEQAVAMSGKARRGIVFGKYMQSLQITPAEEVYRMAAGMELQTGITEDLGNLRTRVADLLTDMEMDRQAEQEKQLLAGAGRKNLLASAPNE